MFLSVIPFSAASISSMAPRLHPSLLNSESMPESNNNKNYVFMSKICMYGVDTWAAKKAQKKFDKAEMRWMWGVTKMDRITNERISGTTKEGGISKKVRERRLSWYDHAMGRDDEYVGKRVMRMGVEGRGKGRRKRGG